MLRPAAFAIACAAPARPPPTFPLLLPASRRAATFLLDECTAVTALHTLPPNVEVRVGGCRATLACTAPHADLALLRLSHPLSTPPSTCLCTAPTLGAHFTVPPPRARDPTPHLVLLRIASEPLLAAGARIPLLVLRDLSHLVAPGWSGAPVVSSTTGAVVGVVAQVFNGDLVHAIPARFLHLLCTADLILPTSFSFLPGLVTQPLIHPAARRAAGAPDVNGVRIARAAHGTLLRTGDLLTNVNGCKVSRQGTIDWHGVNATWQAAVCEVPPGHIVPVEAVRAGVMLTASMAVRDARTALGAKGHAPRQVVLAGEAVFAALSFPLLQRWGDEWRRDAPKDLVEAAFGEMEEGVDDIVVFIGCSAGEGWEQFQWLRAVAVHGRPLRCVRDLVGDGEMVVEFANGFVIALPGGKSEVATFDDDVVVVADAVP